MKLPQEINTTDWAATQDRIFSGELDPKKAEEFNGLCFFQQQICPTNLTIRHGLIMGDVYFGKPNAWGPRAIHDFLALGKGAFWPEGYSYYNYVLTGLEWYRKRHGLPEDVQSAMTRISASYEALKPCPLPEVADHGFPTDGPEIVSTPNYFCKRWKNPDGSIRAYLIIALNTEAMRANLHSHLEAGYFAFGREYFTPHKEGSGIEAFLFHTRNWEWLHRCKPYVSFNFKESFTSSSLSACLPKGAMPPTWRVKPPRVKAWRTNEVTGLETDAPQEYKAFHFSWNNGLLSKQTRKIEVLPDKVVVTDGGFLRRDKVTEYRV